MTKGIERYIVFQGFKESIVLIVLNSSKKYIFLFAGRDVCFAKLLYGIRLLSKV